MGVRSRLEGNLVRRVPSVFQDAVCGRPTSEVGGVDRGYAQLAAVDSDDTRTIQTQYILATWTKVIGPGEEASGDILDTSPMNSNNRYRLESLQEITQYRFTDEPSQTGPDQMSPHWPMVMHPAGLMQQPKIKRAVVVVVHHLGDEPVISLYL